MGNEVKINDKDKNNIDKIDKIHFVANNIEKIDRNSFHIISLIGAGGFSKVWEVKWKKNGKLFAMKEMSKARIIDRKSVKSILAEREILSKMNHPFIINLHFSFQDSNKLYLIIDLAKGQDLRKKIGYSNTNQMNEEQTKFIAGCVILGLEYMHYNQIVHRDIKPENIIMDENGYAKITDFGLSTHLSKLSTKESPGTFSYMAPEIIFHEKTNISLDYYSLGIIVYELMKGIRPYVEFSAKETKDYLLANQFSMKRYAVPEGWGIESADFINRLLLKNPKERLGASGTKELKNHCWFRGFNFKDLYKFKIKSPIIVENKKDEVKIKTIDKETYKRYNKIMKSHEYKTAFKSFLYFNLYDQNLSKDFFINPHEKTANNNKKIINNNKNKDENKSFNLYANNNESISLPIKINISFDNYYTRNNQGKLI
jgi:serine/threonine protein kinase